MKSSVRFPGAHLLVVAACVLLTSCKRDEKPAATNESADVMTGADAFLVLPGDYSERTTAADLEARFGKANVRREAGPEPRIVLFSDDPTRRAYVTFYDAGTFEHLSGISVTDRGSRWRGKHGVQVGMSFAKVRELNGKPFNYFGFDRLERGRAHDGWSPALDGDDGALGAFDVSEGDHLYFDLDFGVPDEQPPEADLALPADEHLSSDDPRFPKLGERIVVTGLGASSSLDDEWN